MLNIQDARDLMLENIPETEWAVPGLFAEGLALFAGKQKFGKSFFLLATGLAVVEGKEVMPGRPVEVGRVLYLSLEDGKRVVQNRLDKMLDGRELPAGLDIAYECKKLNEGGIEDIEGYLSTRPDTKLIMIDVLQHVKYTHITFAA